MYTLAYMISMLLKSMATVVMAIDIGGRGLENLNMASNNQVTIPASSITSAKARLYLANKKK